MPFVSLSNRSIIDVSGPDAEHFLQNLVITDLDKLTAGEAQPGALLTPQGKILFDFLVSRSAGGGFALELRSDIADDFIRRLTLYKLRAKVTIAKRDESLVGVSWETESAASEITSSGVQDARFTEIAVRRYYAAATAPTADEAVWHALRVAHAVAESGTDYALSDAFPHDVLLDQNGGVGFRKGCYVGQEVVSRMQHRGTARRRVLIARSDQALPTAGTDILANGKPIGVLGTVAGSTALAIVRVDRVKDAMDAGQPITASDIPLSLSIPSWARFTFPEDKSEAESA